VNDDVPMLEKVVVLVEVEVEMNFGVMVILAK
jgi:hypothetical protein